MTDAPTKHAPRPAQAYRIERILNEPTRAAIIGDEMGVGKTLVGAEVACAFDRVLIVGVKDTFDQWAERILLQSDGRIVLRLMSNTTKAGKAAFADFLAGKPGHYFTNSQFLTAQDWIYKPAFEKPREKGERPRALWKSVKRTGELVLKDAGDVIGPALLPTREKVRLQKHAYTKMPAVDMFIFDEVHVIANRKSIGGRTVRTIHADRKVGLSGTWYGNKFEGAWSLARWAWPDLIEANFERWKNRHCATENIYVAGGEEQEIITGERNPGAFAASLPCYIRAEAEEKPPAPELVFVELTDIQRWQYEQLERDLLVWLNQKARAGKQVLVADLPITLRQRLRTAALGEMSLSEDGKVTFLEDAQSSKLRALRGIIDYWQGQYVQPVAVYVNSKEFAKLTLGRMSMAGYNAELWSGDASTKERAALKAAFLAGEVQYLIATIASFSTGLDGFQKVCNKLAWLEESENRIMNDQALGRFFRPGRTLEYGGFQHVKILAKDTHDVGIYSSLVNQRLARNAEMRMAA